jgi:HTH-type transcriptional regulator / antitoxin HipB
VIKNERQYKITNAKLEDLETALAAIDRNDPNLHPRQILGRVNSLERTIGDLRTEIDEYDRLKNGEVAEIEVKSLAELPTALIKARIAKGLTQKQLAEQIGIQEQQVQRYEAADYDTISFDRLITIAQILGIDFERSASLALLKN